MDMKKLKIYEGDVVVIYKFSDRVKVVSNRSSGELRTLKDGEIIDRRSGNTMDLESYLISVAKDAEKLKEFTV